MMSTKSLARTIIEGGQAKSAKSERQMETRYERQGVKAALKGLRSFDEEDSDWDDLVLPVRDPHPKDYWDKTNPVERWICQHVGWTEDAIEAHVHVTFERKTVKGRHIVNDHLLRRERYSRNFLNRWDYIGSQKIRLYFEDNRDVNPVPFRIRDGVLINIDKIDQTPCRPPGWKNARLQKNVEAHKAERRAKAAKKAREAAEQELLIQKALKRNGQMSKRKSDRRRQGAANKQAFRQGRKAARAKQLEALRKQEEERMDPWIRFVRNTLQKAT